MGVLPLFIALLSLSSCANNNFGYQDHAGGPHGEPLPKAYYPRRCLVNIGRIVFLDVQVVKRHKRTRPKGLPILESKRLDK